MYGQHLHGPVKSGYTKGENRLSGINVTSDIARAFDEIVLRVHARYSGRTP